MKALLFAGLLAILGCTHCKPLSTISDPTISLPLTRLPLSSYSLSPLEEQVLAKANGIKKWLGVAGCSLQNLFGESRRNSRKRKQFSLRDTLNTISRCIPKLDEEVAIEAILNGKETSVAETNGLQDFLKVAGCALNNIFGKEGYEEAEIERKRRKNKPAAPAPTGFNLKKALRKVAKCIPNSDGDDDDDDDDNEVMNELAVMMVEEEVAQEDEVAQEEEVVQEEEVRQMVESFLSENQSQDDIGWEEEVAQEEEVNEEEEVAEEQVIGLIAKVLGPLLIKKITN